MNNFLTRTITGALFVAVMVFCIWYSYWTMAGLFFVISFLALWEFYSLLNSKEYSPQFFPGLLFGSSVFLGVFFFAFAEVAFETKMLYKAGMCCMLFAFMFPFLSFFIELFRKKETPVVNISVTLLGALYTVVPFALLMIISVKRNDYGNENTMYHTFSYSWYKLLGFFFLIWSNDTFAYLVGRAIGKTKLWERISPKKTWEGFVGGLVLTQAIAYVISIYFTEVALVHWLVIGVIVSVFGTLGDLVESMFKRSLGVKDSGGILPGHGGILDRFDGVLLASPFVCAYLLVIK